MSKSLRPPVAIADPIDRLALATQLAHRFAPRYANDALIAEFAANDALLAMAMDDMDAAVEAAHEAAEEAWPVYVEIAHAWRRSANTAA
jgi:hypothetical protein